MAKPGVVEIAKPLMGKRLTITVRFTAGGRLRWYVGKALLSIAVRVLGATPDITKRETD